MEVSNPVSRLRFLTDLAKCSVATGIGLGIALLLLAPAASFEPQEETNLARLLANEKTRARAINKIVPRAKELELLLLRWTESPPHDVDKYNLYFGLIEVFGRLRTPKAIPFLIDHINWRYPVNLNFSLKSAEAIIAQSPAIEALLRIGPRATIPLMQAYRRPLTPDDRLAVIFTLAQLKDGLAKEFLLDARRHAYQEIHSAEQGLGLLGEKIEHTKIK